MTGVMKGRGVSDRRRLCLAGVPGFELPDVAFVCMHPICHHAVYGTETFLLYGGILPESRPISAFRPRIRPTETPSNRYSAGNWPFVSGTRTHFPAAFARPAGRPVRK